ncbi:substrate-binding periplasmic protein [Thalassotalea atypica]|uniref:substrate-binding periplasmic protein n=1 Tax=Thalassotalea atypica TaxID=2054316 RepID=UPI0025725868|nr:transporter substrate-binding domain-containing protein [Thalassotalea atypica]
MKKTAYIISVYIALICSFNAYAEHANMHVGWELWYPYQYHDKKGQLVGIDIESFNAIGKQVGIKYSYDELPWKRHLQLLKNGQMDIAFGASFTAEREEYAYFTKPYRKEQVNLFVRKGNVENIKLTQLSDLVDSSYLIGVEGGYFYGAEYQELIKNPKFQEHISEVIDIEENVTMLIKGHIDGFLVDPLTLAAFAKKYQMEEEFELHSLPIYQDTIHIMLSKKSCSIELLQQFNQAISKLQANGELGKIINSQFQK